MSSTKRQREDGSSAVAKKSHRGDSSTSAAQNSHKKAKSSPPSINAKSNNGGVAKRRIDRSIQTNRGLTPYRKKDARNSRVKHRKKYEKALKRRRGQVRETLSNDRPYEGELTGINPRVVRAVQLGPKKL